MWNFQLKVWRIDKICNGVFDDIAQKSEKWFTAHVEIFQSQSFLHYSTPGPEVNSPEDYCQNETRTVLYRMLSGQMLSKNRIVHFAVFLQLLKIYRNCLLKFLLTLEFLISFSFVAYTWTIERNKFFPIWTEEYKNQSKFAYEFI